MITRVTASVCRLGDPHLEIDQMHVLEQRRITCPRSLTQRLASALTGRDHSPRVHAFASPTRRGFAVDLHNDKRPSDEA